LQANHRTAGNKAGKGCLYIAQMADIDAQVPGSWWLQAWRT
jgi:hypothetical protein